MIGRSTDKLKRFCLNVKPTILHDNKQNLLHYTTIRKYKLLKIIESMSLKRKSKGFISHSLKANVS